MANKKTWSERVAEWRASGLTAEKFSEGRGFSKKTLFRWSSRLGKAGREPPRTTLSRFPMVRVVRQPEPDRPETASPGVMVEVAGVRLIVPRGADATTVRVVLEAARDAASEESTR